jgi:hypothetical protein
MQNSVDLEVKNDTIRRIDCLNSYQNDSEIATFKPISQIKLGDKVLAKSEWKADADSLSYEAVTDIMLTPNQERTLVHINLSNGQKITTTDGHPFKTTEGWRDAVLLKKGGKLLLKGDAEQALEITDISQSTEKVTTYNLEVANAHTFFVGEQGVLVHNGRGAQGKARESIWEACGGMCSYCGCSLQRSKGFPNSFECDHYDPVGAGGDPGTDNQVGSCRTCNRHFGKNKPGGGVKPTLPGR